MNYFLPVILATWLAGRIASHGPETVRRTKYPMLGSLLFLAEVAALIWLMELALP